MSLSTSAGYLISDVVNVTGITAGTADAYVLQMSFSPSQLTSGSGSVAAEFNGGYLFLATLSGGTWENATAVGVNGPAGINAGVKQNMSWSNFLSGKDGDALSTLIGSWGVDTANNVAWAVIDYGNNNQFAVVPEPGTLLLLAAGALALAPVIRRRRRRASKTG